MRSAALVGRGARQADAAPAAGVRPSDSLKRALQARAGARGLSLHAAGVELLKRGLEASEDERASEGLTRELAAATSELDQPRAQLARLTFACRLRWHASS